MQTNQEKVTPIVVPVCELPEYVSVHTYFITRRFAKENKIKNVLKISKRLANFLAIEQANDVNDVPTNEPTHVPARWATMVARGTMTKEAYSPKESAPCRMREIQTDSLETADVGVQCEMDVCDDVKWWDVPVVTSDHIEQEDAFPVYVIANTEMFPNGMLECLICGEVGKFLAEHQSHMALHFGPPALCPSCGTFLEHQYFISQHNYNCPARPHARSLPKMHLQCPHLHCSFMVTSKKQLRQHLSKHLGIKAYHCLQCRKSFSSSTQFLVHRMMKATCSKAKYIYLAKNYPQTRAKTKIQRCTVCMRTFSNARRCASHKFRCIRQHNKRLEQLLIK